MNVNVAADKNFGAFISYSHRADQDLAVALRRGLHQLAKPWYRPRAMKVFLDNASLSTNPALWDSLCTSLQRSDKLILLCSPEAAASEWVAKEIKQFLSTSTVDSILPVLTSGELFWDDARGDIDLERSTAASPALAGIFKQEPRFLDLRWAAESSDLRTLNLRNPRFLEAVADLAAPIRRVPKDELVGEDIAQHRRTRMIARVGVSALTVLLLVSVVAGLLARSNSIRANRNAERAEKRRIEAEARRLSSDASRLEGPGDLAFLLAASAHRLEPTVASVDTLFEVADRYLYLESITHLGAPVLAFDRDIASGDVVVGFQDTETKPKTEPDPPTTTNDSPQRSRVARYDARGKLLAGPVEISGLVRRISFLNGRVIVATTGTLKMLDPKTLTDIGEFESPTGFYVTAAISTAAGGLIAGSSDRGIFVYRADGPDPEPLTDQGEYAWSISILADGDIVAMTRKPGESVSDIVRFEPVAVVGGWRETWRTPTLRIATAMTVDEGLGKVFVGSASGDVAAFDAASGRRTLLYTNTIDSRITAIAVNGPLLGLADSVGRVWVRSASDDSLESSWQAHQGATTALVAVPAGGSTPAGFVSGGTDGSIAIHSVDPAFRFTTRTRLPDQATSVRIDRGSNSIWVGTPTAVLRRDIASVRASSDEPTGWETVDIGSVASAIEPVSDDAVAVGDYRGMIHLVKNGSVVSTVDTGGTEVFALAWNPLLKQLYAITSVNELSVFNFVGNKLVAGQALSKETVSGQLIAVSEDGRRAAFTTFTGVEVVDSGTGKVVRTFPASFENYAEAFALDATGERLALGDVGRVRIFDVGTGAEKVQTPLVSDPVSVSFAKAESGLDSEELLVVVLRDHSAVRVEASSGRLAGRLRTSGLAALDATSEDLQWFADTSGGTKDVVTSNERTLYLTDLSIPSVLKESCRRFGRELSALERLRFSLSVDSKPCDAPSGPA